MSSIVAKNLIKKYGRAKALDDFSFNFERGKQYAIQGASGSGKSTLLYMLGGLEQPSAGSIFVEGKNIIKFEDDALAQYRNRYVGFVFQFHYLLPTMKCIDNIMLPSKIGGIKSGGSIKDNVHDLAKKLGVIGQLDKYPYELSGGEQQRINLIRAISLRPKLLLCDEPTGSLDSENSEMVSELLKNVASQYDATLIVVTHDNNIAAHYDNIIQLRDGHLV